MDFQEWENRVSILDRKYNHFDLWVSYDKVKKYILKLQYEIEHSVNP